MEFRFCPDCADETDFVTPECPDGHADCPERVCATCGFAVVVGWLDVDAAPGPRVQRAA